MSTYNFIPDDVFDRLPEDTGERFEALVDIARGQYKLAAANKQKADQDQVTIAFMSQIRVIAKELGLGNIRVATSTPVLPNEWTQFESDLVTLRTKRRLRKGGFNIEASVELSRVTKFRIEQEIEKLRDLVNSSELPAKKQKALNGKLDELLEELHRQRLSFTKLAAVAAAIAGVLGGTSATLANGPEAVATIGRILHWVGEEKAAEEEEQLKLAAPLKALPAPNDEPEEQNASNS
jgi:hypothetical protein